jgi:hypothetical protein
MLAGVDLNGNTIFNARQMRALREEVATLLAGDLSVEEHEGLLGIVVLCDQGQRPPHQFLWFIGD